MKKVMTLLLMVMLGLSSISLSACNNSNNITDSNTANQPELEEVEQEQVVNENDDETIDENDLSPNPDGIATKHEVVLYFSDKDLMNTYRVKKIVEVRKESDLPKAALEAWIDGPDHEELMELLPSNVIIEYVEGVNGVANVSFSKEIKDSNLGSTGEIMFAEQLAMIMSQFGYEKTQILVEGKVTESVLGHLYTGEPIVAGSLETYSWIDEKESNEIVLQNVAFRILEPAPNTEVKDQIVISGLARVFEATFMYEFEDGHYILDEGVATASEGAPGWGEFEIVIELDEVANYSGTVILYEVSAKDGSRVNELKIPVNVVK